MGYNLCMAYQVLYRTYRPAKFSEVVGQDYIVKTLVNSIQKERIAHAYLFAGPRGTGKTSVAKLFAKAINCDEFKDEACDECNSCKSFLEGVHPDIIEMDAASNNGVDEIRKIVDQVSYAPILGKYKVYIIDEVHMLSSSAFNALLKTLEEPPAHVVFILATTDPQKVLPTVLSRCQRYNFSKISTFEIQKKIEDILNKEEIKFEEKAIAEIARMAEGGMRDALSLLEQCLSYNNEEIKLEDVENIFGLVSTPKEVELFINAHKNQTNEVISEVRNLYQLGADTKRLTLDLLEIVKEAIIYSDKAETSLLNKLSASEAQEIITKISINDLIKDIDYIEDTLNKDKQNQNHLSYLELCLIKMARKTEIITENTTKVIYGGSVKKQEKQEKQEESTSFPKQEQIEKSNDEDIDFLLKVLLNANKDYKINDQIIYNKLGLYQYEPEKRKFYQLLSNTELFASSTDAIIVSGNRANVSSINDKSINKELYKFVVKEFGIDKMIYAIDEDTKKQLIEKYKSTPAEKRNVEVIIEKYKIENETKKPEDTLSLLFGEKVKVED